MILVNYKVILMLIY